MNYAVAMNGKIATGLLGLIVAVSVAGCSNDPSTETASSTPAPTSTTSSSSMAPEPTTADAPAPTPADAPAPEAPAEPAEPAEPAAPTDATQGVTGEELYQQTCTQFLPSIDALEQTGISDRAKSVEGLRTEMTTAPSWNDVPPGDQNEILRGLDAAGAGQC